MPIASRIVPCLWFDHQAEEAAHFYTGIFPRSAVVQVLRYGEAGHEVHGRPAGSVMTVEFDLDGQRFTALNGGPVFQFNEAVSLQVLCDNQDEVDHFWQRLSAGGPVQAQQCGWLKDRYGVSWQVVPTMMQQMMAHPDRQKVERAFAAMLTMKRLDIAALQRAFDGAA